MDEMEDLEPGEIVLEFNDESPYPTRIVACITDDNEISIGQQYKRNGYWSYYQDCGISFPRESLHKLLELMG